MKQLLYASSILVFIITILFANPSSVLANEGEGGHALEMDVNGYHVTLDSQNKWVKGENTLVVTIMDSMGMPLSDAEVEILIAPKEDGHESSETDAHGSGQEEAMTGMDMGESPEQNSSMPGMDTGSDQQHESVPGVMSPNNPSDMSTHEEEATGAIAMTESEHGMYTAENHFESAGEHNVHVMFHVNGEMLQADFLVKVTGSSSKTFVLWSFVAVNVALVVTAATLKKQKSITVKGGK
jgi:hypothetical protein